jgi:hypothetical protein
LKKGANAAVALYEGCGNNCKEVVQALLEQGVDVDVGEYGTALKVKSSLLL